MTRKRTKKIIRRAPGGGRKPIYPQTMVRLSIRVTPDQLAHLERKYVNPSAGVRALVEYDIQNNVEV